MAFNLLNEHLFNIKNLFNIYHIFHFQMKLDTTLQSRTSALSNCTQKLSKLNQDRSFLCVRVCVHAHAHAWVDVCTSVVVWERGRQRKKEIFFPSYFIFATLDLAIGDYQTLIKCCRPHHMLLPPKLGLWPRLPTRRTLIFFLCTSCTLDIFH